MLPTREVPLGLTGDEYLKLSIQYMVMGWKKQMVIAAKRAMENGSDLRALAGQLSEDDYKTLGQLFGFLETTMEFNDQAGEVVKSAVDAMQEFALAADKALDEFLPLGDVKQDIQDTLKGWFKQASDALSKTVEEVVMPALGLPGRELPQGLTAEEYFRLGQQYKAMGWTEQARDALLLVKEIEPDGEVCEKAMRFLRTKVPRQPVPHHAVQRNIAGHNQLVAGQLDAAKKQFEKLIEDYPQFEWPYGNLGAVYLQMGEFEKAKDTLWKALDLNPDYVNAWIHLGRTHAALLEMFDANRSLDKALKLDPDDEAAKAIKQMLDLLSSL